MVLDGEVVGVDISKMVLTEVMRMCYRAVARGWIYSGHFLPER